jgi:hypothetical protein
VGLLGLTLAFGTTLLVGVVKVVPVVVINIIAGKDIADQFQDRRLANTSLPNEKDGVWRLHSVLRRLNDTLLERLCVARKNDQG